MGQLGLRRGPVTGNTSAAVRAQRVEPHDSLDDFPTPPWATRALLERLDLSPGGRETCWEPACNRGHMVAPLRERFRQVHATDVFDYGFAGMAAVEDFLFAMGRNDAPLHDFVVTNPPFKLGQAFALEALRVARRGVALFVRTGFLAGGERYDALFRRDPPTEIWQFCERVVIHKGVLRDPSKEYWDEAAQKMRRPSTATDYQWLIWYRDGRPRRPLEWIPPCRTRLERPGDYPE